MIVFPVPGLPVNDICKPGFPELKPFSLLTLSTSKRAEISRIRVFTGTKPTNSSSNRSKVFLMSVLIYSSCNSTYVYSILSAFDKFLLSILFSSSSFFNRF